MGVCMAFSSLFHFANKGSTIGKVSDKEEEKTQNIDAF